MHASRAALDKWRQKAALLGAMSESLMVSDAIAVFDETLAMSDPKTLREAVERLLTNDVMERVYAEAHKGRTGVYSAIREVLMDAILAAHPDAPEPGTSTLDLVESVRKLLGAYAREITARSRWAAEAEPWSPQSKAMFGAVLDREAETRDAALAVGAIVFPAETGALPPPASRREVARLTEDRERIEKALDRARATMIRAMDALESDAELDARREAFEMIQEQFEGVSTEDAARAEALIPQLREALDAARREDDK
jgi:hypothetical protein